MIRSKIYRLKNYINKCNIENIDSTYIIVFNYLIDYFPTPENFFTNVKHQSPDWLVVYTILAYENSQSLTSCNYLFIDALCNNIINKQISYFNIKKITELLLVKEVKDIINYALDYKYISPNYIISSILNIYSPYDIKANTKKIISILKKYIDNYDYQMFNNNFDFINIYNTLTNLWNDYLILKLDISPLNLLESLKDFDKLPNQEHIKSLFSSIEKKDTDISSKFQDCLTIITRYSYELS